MAGIERIDSQDGDENTFVFTNGEQPPAYAVVDFLGDTDLAVDGPFDEAQLEDHFATYIGPRSDAQQAAHDARPFGYRVTIDSAGIEGEYEGGRERAARNLAVFVFDGMR